VRDDVLKLTHNRQEPFIYGSLGGDDVALVPAPAVVDFNKAAKDDYELAQQINVISAWDSFIGKYPSGFYSDLARAQRDKLIAAKAAAEEADRLAAQKKAQRVNGRNSRHRQRLRRTPGFWPSKPRRRKKPRRLKRRLKKRPPRPGSRKPREWPES